MIRWTHERALWEQGFTAVAGTDEAGSGAWAGPVYAGAVILPKAKGFTHVNDSKQLSAAKREELFQYIQAHAVSWAITFSSVQEISELGIRNAGLLAMKRAIEQLSPAPDWVLSDAFTPTISMPCTPIIRGDAVSRSIAAASILAKVARDHAMDELGTRFPVYGFAQHKGYGTKQHQHALDLHGPCEIHRMTYAPLRKYLT